MVQKRYRLFTLYNGDIKVSPELFKGKQHIPYVLSNVSGQVISEGLLDSGNGTVHVPNLPQRIYILRIGEGNDVETYKLVKK